jgi:hypothetical protein
MLETVRYQGTGIYARAGQGILLSIGQRHQYLAMKRMAKLR